MIRNLLNAEDVGGEKVSSTEYGDPGPGVDPVVLVQLSLVLSYKPVVTLQRVNTLRLDLLINCEII